MSFKSRKFSLTDISKRKAAGVRGVDGVWSEPSSAPLRALCRRARICMVVARQQGQKMVFMVQPRQCISKARRPNLLPFLRLPFIVQASQVSRMLHHPFLPPSSFFFFKKHPSAPRNVNSPGFKYARSELGVNHHFVFITHSLSSLSRCARGMRSSGVMEVFVLLLAPVLCLPASAPPQRLR